MPGTKTLKEHDALMTRMARLVGTDLDEAELRGDLSPEMRHDMLSRCVGCSAPQDCAHFLDTTPIAESTPDYCRNGMVLMALRDI
ncbi:MULTISPECIES: DUF6455 family protein [Paracoccaceae]|jgi:hypothetical protein|uniref:DUF6455 family protein n=1 Tax=Rhodobacterales TaxID=204455 RepID=UPI001B208FBE|nr:DUF6455 family protein [Boseongicola sp. H5]MBO6601971.1 hypothetical protein [Roseicyclus sp.]MBO6623595.1 hypothetical protein [Roseicyclus sp.]MBO6921689.1 hypothetical protein [Roseicyclus sp.]